MNIFIKKRYLFLIFLFIFTSCVSPKMLEGNWNTVALIKEGQPVPLMESNIKIIIKDKTLKAKGCSGVNLYNCNIAAKGKKFTASDMENTGFMGLGSEMEYENLFFQALMNAENYVIQDDMLYIYAPSMKLEMQLKKK